LAKIDGGRVIAKVLKEEGVKHLHTLGGGHNIPIVRGCVAEGIDVFGYRGELGVAHAADGYARGSRGVGVACITAGVGVTNAMTGIASAFVDNIPMVVLAGRHNTADDGKGALQEMDGVDAVIAVTKWRKCVHDFSQLAPFTAAAFREALSPSPGPTFLEIPYDILSSDIEDSYVRIPPSRLTRTEGRVHGDAACIEKATAMLIAAEKPVVVSGDGAFWSGVGSELKELAELLQLPVYTTRLGQGTLSEYHPLSVHRVVRSKLTRECDVALSLGVKFWRGEGFGNEPAIWNPEYKLIQVDPAENRIGHNVAPEVSIWGDPKAVVGQILECAKEMLKSKTLADRAAWLEALKKHRQDLDERNVEEVKANADKRPIHPAVLCQAIMESIEPDTTVVYDGMYSVSFMERYMKATIPGQVIPLNLHGAMGPGVPWAIGAQLGRPDKRLVLLSGDGAFGIGGMEIETAAKYNLPIVIVLHNNNAWFPRLGTDQEAKAYTFQPRLRYDRMAEALGCYGQFVDDPAEVKPAIKRALESGKPSLVNCIVDPTASSGLYSRGGQGAEGARGALKVRFW